jgi:hypothetical protein
LGLFGERGKFEKTCETLFWLGLSGRFRLGGVAVMVQMWRQMRVCLGFGGKAEDSLPSLAE